MHPRWPELREMDERLRHLRQSSQMPLPASSPAHFPAAITAATPLPIPPRHHDADAVSAMANAAREAAVAQQRDLEQRQQRRLDNARLQEETELQTAVKQLQSDAEEDSWREQRAILIQYQSQVTQLRLRVDRLRDPARIAAARKRQEQDLKRSLQELQDLEHKRDEAVQAVKQRYTEMLRSKEQQLRAEGDARVRVLEAELAKQRELFQRTALSDQEELLAAAEKELTAAPPTMKLLPAKPETLPAPSDWLRASGVKLAVPTKELRELQKNRDHLAAQLRDEVRRRVLAIARRNQLRPRFDGVSKNLPDRTRFFARELRLTMPKAWGQEVD
ncbi:MAG TPA: hypothetical protein VHR86_08085 [Armatimonadota bacterium]|nr:hypothetical protein [Armatimonadota bacterium]